MSIVIPVLPGLGKLVRSSADCVRPHPKPSTLVARPQAPDLGLSPSVLKRPPFFSRPEVDTEIQRG